MSLAAAKSFLPYVEEEEPEFQNWIADQDLSNRKMVLWNFHRWMRQETNIGSGSIVDYRKQVAEMLSEDGELIEIPNDRGCHMRAAVNKFREFRDNAKTNAEGDDWDGN